MNIQILVEVDNSLLDVNLKSVESKNQGEKFVKWIGYANEKEDSRYSICIYQDTDTKQVSKIEIGSEIKTDTSDIKHEFVQKFSHIIKGKIDIESMGFEDTEDVSETDSEMNPYDPDLIRVDTRQLSINYIYQMMIADDKELDLSPDFQRNFVWNDITRKSRLIESLLLRIPLPVFYFSQDKEGRYQVIDGVQRLTVIKSFFNNEFKLKNLEYLKDCEGKYFKKREGDNSKMKYIDAKYVRWINQTQLVCNIIDPQTPPEVKFDIFRRINTGGMILNPQEIRNCLSNSNTRKLLKDLSISREFIVATDNSINTTRMADQELVLRYIGFYYYKLMHHKNLVYKGNMDTFLDEVVTILNEERIEIINNIKIDFINSMRNATYLFGKYAFRKCSTEHIKQGAKKQLLNKSLFITISIVLSRYKNQDIESRFDRGQLINAFAYEIENDRRYMEVLTNGTSDYQRLNYSFDIAENIICRELRSIDD